MQQVIDECRRRITPAPRAFSLEQRLGYHRTPVPEWMRKNRADGLWEIYRKQGTVLVHGVVVWAYLVQANESLFQPGNTDAPATAIYSLDPYFDDHLETLADIADRLYALKSAASDDPEFAEFHRIITDEMDRSLHIPIPTHATEGRQVVATCIMVRRKHLPHGILSHGAFPMLVNPKETPATLILPSRYWSPTLLRAWGAE